MQLADVAAKAAAGYPVTAGDIYGRLLVYNLFPGADGGVALTMSGLTSSINFTEHKVPYPIITSIGTNASSSGDCSAPPDATQYEYTPHEFGSWDKGVNSFVQMAHLGSNISNGTAVHGNCTSGFDNLGFVTASTSNIFGFLCHPVYNSIGAVAQLADALQVRASKRQKALRTYADTMAARAPFLGLRAPRQAVCSTKYPILSWRTAMRVRYRAQSF